MRSLLVLVLSLLACAATIQAANGPGETTGFTTLVEREPVNTIEPVFRAYINVAADKFTFIIPNHFQMGGDPEHGLLRLNNVESDCSITFTIVGSLSADGTGLDKDAYRELVNKRHADGKITGEFTAVALGKQGPGFDVDWKSETGLFRSTRTVFLQSVAGVLELSVTSNTRNFSAAQGSLNSVLGTLRSSFGGKLVVSRLGDRS